VRYSKKKKGFSGEKKGIIPLLKPLLPRLGNGRGTGFKWEVQNWSKVLELHKEKGSVEWWPIKNRRTHEPKGNRQVERGPSEKRKKNAVQDISLVLFGTNRIAYKTRNQKLSKRTPWNGNIWRFQSPVQNPDRFYDEKKSAL